jgi:hypothetical protein
MFSTSLRLIRLRFLVIVVMPIWLDAFLNTFTDCLQSFGRCSPRHRASCDCEILSIVMSKYLSWPVGFHGESPRCRKKIGGRAELDHPLGQTSLSHQLALFVCKRSVDRSGILEHLLDPRSAGARYRPLLPKSAKLAALTKSPSEITDAHACRRPPKPPRNSGTLPTRPPRGTARIRRRNATESQSLPDR